MLWYHSKVTLHSFTVLFCSTHEGRHFSLTILAYVCVCTKSVRVKAQSPHLNIDFLDLLEGSKESLIQVYLAQVKLAYSSYFL